MQNAFGDKHCEFGWIQRSTLAIDYLNQPFLESAMRVHNMQSLTKDVVLEVVDDDELIGHSKVLLPRVGQWYCQQSEEGLIVVTSCMKSLQKE